MAIGTFLAAAIDANGGDLRGLVSSALAHYRDALDRVEPPIGVPSFLGVPARRLIEVDLSIEPALERLLRTEAIKQRVAVEAILSHAVFLYLADLDRGAGASAAG